jgi:uridine kinase
LPLDAYYRDLSDLEPVLRGERNFDHPDALDHQLLTDHLRLLAAGKAVDVPVYRFETHSRAPTGRPLRPGAWLIVEGLFTFYWEKSRRLLETKVFIDAGHDLCLSRRLERDVRERGRTADSVRAQYDRTVRPMCERYILPTRRHADVVVAGAGSPELNADRVLDLIDRSC